MADAINYKSSGVDIEAGDRLVDWLATQKKTGNHKQVLGGIGGFAALFKLDLIKYKKPVLVSCTDGVGTKVKLAVQLGKIRPTGIDLVAMCVNDLIVCGADPLFFLDYYASGKLDLSQAQELLQGVLDGLEQSHCTLVGGETAEMPGVYADKDYDCAGFCVGVVDEDRVITGQAIKTGDVAVGIASSGFHSNGYSLLRKVFEKEMDEWGERLMVPTRIYVGLVQALKKKIQIKGMAHITGGGIVGNAPRVMPENTALKLQPWPWSDNFKDVMKRAGMSLHEMLETLNCGIGYIFYVDPKDAPVVVNEAKRLGWAAFTVGHVIGHEGEAKVIIE